MNNIQSAMERFIVSHYDDNQRFCLFNGFAGFSYGTPSNPKFIDDAYARELLEEYELITNKDPFAEMENSLMTLLFDDSVKQLVIKTGYRMLGYFNPEKCLYGENGLG